jgi:hypothetical protein
MSNKARRPSLGLAAVVIALLGGACRDDVTSVCTNDSDCARGSVCDDGRCRIAEDADRPRRDVVEEADDDRGVDTPADQAADSTPGDATEDGPEPGDGGDGAADTPAEDAVPDSAQDASGEPDADPYTELSAACAAFCEALCAFLEECGKHDVTCPARCGDSTRYQQLSTAACTEGSQVIGLEECPLWLDCGGEACDIDEMCLELIPDLSYQCAPICDRTQANPPCPDGVSCSLVMDAESHVMVSLGMCWSL